MAHWRETGKGNIGCIVGLVLLAAALLIGIRVVPTRLAVAELQDYCEREAEQASLPRFTDDKITDAILIKAVEEHLPVKKEDIKVSRDQAQVRVEVRYRVVLDLLVYQYNWDVEHKVERTLF
ncbi:MAG: hypothetical protein LAO05_02590 [Acidobacteriia bacterium]|nr:hypothetical protein [Terriglobia bacterium]